MSNRGQGAKKNLFEDLGKLFYDWHKKDPSGLVCKEEARGCDMEIGRLAELIDYVAKKREQTMLTFSDF